MNQTLITLLFEIKRHKGRFYIFTLIGLIVPTLLGLLPYLINPDTLPKTFNNYAISLLTYIDFIIIFGSCFFFSGIISEEFQSKTYLILFPKINKLKLIIRKILGNLLLFIIVLSIYFTFNAILGLIFFQQLTIEFLFSYIFCIFYGITVSTFILLISSLMRSVSSLVVISVLILLSVLI